MKMMLGTKNIPNQVVTPYATRADFCRVFEKNTNSLYLLCFLLTADRDAAEKCFVSGLEDSAQGSPVFAAWAESWARRTIIDTAIRMIRPRPQSGEQTKSGAQTSTSDNTSDHNGRRSAIEPAMIAAVIDLSAFDRFVFVMSVLERYSDQECSLLLDCSRTRVVAARIRALQQIGNSAEVHRGLVGVGGDLDARADEKPLRDDRRAKLQMLFPSLAPSA
jgi:DNA-directed RNA polymerase specialized sigma24 family protein